MADPTNPDPAIPPFPPTQPEPGRRAGRSPWLVGVAGVVVGALVAGIPLLLTRSSGGGLGVSHEALHAPANLNDFTPMTSNPKMPPATKKRTETAETMSAKNLSEAYGGAATTVRKYIDPELGDFVTLEAIRATSPKPYVPYVDAATIGFAKPLQEVDTIGQTSCVVQNVPGSGGKQDTHVQICERTSSHLTVRLRFDGEGWDSLEDAVALTERAWSALS
ncbi:MAG: hypothetical protein AUG49_12340 [Catenulispora sp. 13_1_20CM_3_70_7]|nr:MAG: hypothetical protein AUG49_12340 [Catenulispora sp. 13_1_20CM_3_70_7]